jgi:hypothetical protein
LIDPGIYEVCETLQAGWFNTTPLCLEVVVEEEDIAKVMFGNAPDPTPRKRTTWSRLKSTYR